jgi:hypothetical protein
LPDLNWCLRAPRISRTCVARANQWSSRIELRIRRLSWENPVQHRVK